MYVRRGIATVDMTKKGSFWGRKKRCLKKFPLLHGRFFGVRRVVVRSILKNACTWAVELFACFRQNASVLFSVFLRDFYVCSLVRKLCLEFFCLHLSL